MNQILLNRPILLSGAPPGTPASHVEVNKQTNPLENDDISRALCLAGGGGVHITKKVKRAPSGSAPSRCKSVHVGAHSDVVNVSKAARR